MSETDDLTSRAASRRKRLLDEFNRRLAKGESDRKLLAGELELSGYDPDSADFVERDRVYEAGRELGVTPDQIDKFAKDVKSKREIQETGRTATEYGTKGDGSYYAKRDEAARKRNAAQAGNRGATKTRGLDRHAELQGTPTGYSHSGSRDKRKLESEEGRAERYARRAARKGDQATASRVRTESFAKELKHPTPNIKSEDYRAQEEANRLRILEDAKRRQEISDKSQDVYSDLLDRIKQRRYEETK